jgi:nucleoside-diphosphate-sugar epimerase
MIGLTGLRGVLGGHIQTSLAAQGHEVSAFSGDIRDYSAVVNWVTGVDAFIHCAAVAATSDMEDNLFRSIATNVAGSANLALAAQRRGCRMIYISTSHVYEPSDQPLPETGRISPASHYGLSKLQGEQWVRRLSEANLAIRVFSYFDARQSPPFLVPSLRRRIMNSEPEAELDLHGGLNGRDFMDAEWVAEVCVRLALSGAGGVVNCGSGQRTGVIEIAGMLSRLLGRPDLRWKPLQEGQPSDLVAETSLLRKLVPDLPQFDLQRSLARYVNVAP